LSVLQGRKPTEFDQPGFLFVETQLKLRQSPRRSANIRRASCVRWKPITKSSAYRTMITRPRACRFRH
jgi:hypothetical protein